MSVPEPIEPVHFSEPRGVLVRESGNLSNVHSAVSGNVNIYSGSQLESNELIKRWPEIMQAVADKANSILAELRVPDEQ